MKNIKKLSINTIALFLIALLVLNSVHADSITYPFNNSNLATNQIYNLTLDINSISTTSTSDVAQIIVNNSIIYQNTYTANGLYHVPIEFFNSGMYNIKLKTTTTNETLNYIVNPSATTSLSNFWNEYSEIFIELGFFGVIALIIKKFLKKSKIQMLAISIMFFIINLIILLQIIPIISSYSIEMFIVFAITLALSLTQIILNLFKNR
jgi:hypothetical protein